jgi:DNA-binding transcriptional regulator YiaG
MKKEVCAECGKELRVVTGNYRFDEVGVPVLLQNVPIAQCKECGITEPIVADLNGLMNTIAFAVVGKPCKLTGHDVRFLRKYIGVSADEFSELVKVQPETLSRWENNQQDIGKNSDRLIRFVVVSKSEDLRMQMEEFLKKYRQLSDCDSPRKSQLKIDPATLQYEFA